MSETLLLTPIHSLGIQVYRLLWEPFTLDFMAEALWAGIFAACCCALLSAFIVNKGWALVGDAVSHAVLPGIITAYLVSIPLMIGAMVSGLLCVLLAGSIDARTRVKSDAVLGICYTGFLALGLVMLSRVVSEVHFTHILLGHLLGIPTDALVQLLIAGGLAITLMLLRYRDLKLYCFDDVQARAVGLGVAGLRLLLMLCLALTTVASLQAVGLIQVIAMLITPGCTGLLVSRRFTHGVIVGMGSAATAVWLGLVVAFHYNLAPGSCIVLAQCGFFLLALCLSHRGPGRYLVASLKSRIRSGVSETGPDVQ